MSKTTCCPVCPLNQTAAQEKPNLDACVGVLADELLATRATAEAMRDYLNRIIIKADELLDLLGEADWSFGGEEEE